MSNPTQHCATRARLWAACLGLLLTLGTMQPLGADGSAPEPSAPPAGDPSGAEAPPHPPLPGPAPFVEGELASYELRYGPIKAGTLTLEVAPIAELPTVLVPTVLVPGVSTEEATEETSEDTEAGIDTSTFWRFVGRARSSSLISRFYRVDDSIEGWVERDTFRPRTLEIRVDESGERGTRHVLYDHDEGVARYERQRIFHRKRGPSMLTRDDPLDRQAFDAFSLFFYLRTLDLAPGDRLDLPVHENGKNRRVQIVVKDPEKVATALGDRQALRLEIRWTLEGKLASRRAYHLWLADDDSRLPVRFAAELGFGSLRGVLQEVRTLDPDSTAEVGAGDVVTAQ